MTYGQGYVVPGIAGVPGITVVEVRGVFPTGGVPGIMVGGVPGVSGVKMSEYNIHKGGTAAVAIPLLPPPNGKLP